MVQRVKSLEGHQSIVLSQEPVISLSAFSGHLSLIPAAIQSFNPQRLSRRFVCVPVGSKANSHHCGTHSGRLKTLVKILALCQESVLYQGV